MFVTGIMSSFETGKDFILESYWHGLYVCNKCMLFMLSGTDLSLKPHLHFKNNKILGYDLPFILDQSFLAPRGQICCLDNACPLNFINT